MEEGPGLTKPPSFINSFTHSFPASISSTCYVVGPFLQIKQNKTNLGKLSLLSSNPARLETSTLLTMDVTLPERFSTDNV